MNVTGEILNRYQQADEDQRLSLFMNYRELREEFQEIDRTIAPAAVKHNEPEADRLFWSRTFSCFRRRLTVILEGR